ncbi:MAG TPA: carboxypeptidase-like regulatory domain-containing protein [Pirellulales bacterium]|nr:carboxypeptidase-like regulatory domain-containing protein [Pirellulales bacterium]
MMILQPPRFIRLWGALIATPVLMSLALAARAEEPAIPRGDLATTSKTIVSGRVLLPDGQRAAAAQVAVAGHRRWHRRRGGRHDSEILGQAVADDTGNFELTTPRTSTAEFYDLFALAALDGYALGMTPLDADSQRSSSIVQLGKEEVLRLRLIDLEGQPAAGVELFVYQIGVVRSDWGGWFQNVTFSQSPERLPFWPRRMKSDDEGRVALGGFSQASGVVVVVDDPRFARERTTLGGNKGEKEQILSLPPSQIIEGTVSYADTGAPAPNTRLTMRDAVGNSDDRGRFRINPSAGAKMTILAFAAEGEPYLTTHTTFEWPKGAAKHTIDVALPRGVLAQGHVVDQDGESITGAAVQYRPLLRNPNNRDSLQLGWQYSAHTDTDGNFALPVLPGEGHLLIQGPHGDFIHQEIGSRVIDVDQPGGERLHPDAVIRLDVPPDKESVRADATLRRGVTVRGRLVGPDDEPVRRATIVSRLQVLGFRFHGHVPTEIFDGNFELHGLDPEQSYPVHFLATDNEWGATATISGRQAGELVTVRLVPCGTASARLLNKNGTPLGGRQQTFELVVTPGVARHDRKAQEKGLLAMDGDFVANLDRQHNWGLKTDDMGYISYPALIPGATYRLTIAIPDVAKEFTAESGKNTELGELTLPVE